MNLLEPNIPNLPLEQNCRHRTWLTFEADNTEKTKHIEAFSLFDTQHIEDFDNCFVVSVLSSWVKIVIICGQICFRAHSRS